MTMNVAAIVALAVSLIAAGCSRDKQDRSTGFEIQPGSQVTLEKKDGVRVEGRLVEVTADQVVVERRDGGRATVSRAEIATVRADATTIPATKSAAAEDPAGKGPVGSTSVSDITRRDPAAAPAGAAPPARERSPELREVTAPAGTVLLAELATAVSSDVSNIEDPVRATLRQPLRVGGEQVLPTGTTLLGHVVAAERSARVKGRARIAFRFTAVDPPGDAERLKIQTEAISRRAPATKKEDAAKIGGGAAGGAIIGGILGGGDGAAKGAAIGGAAGTGVVLSTRGKEVRLGPGADIAVRLAAPVTFRVPVR